MNIIGCPLVQNTLFYFGNFDISVPSTTASGFSAALHRYYNDLAFKDLDLMNDTIVTEIKS